MKERLAQKKYCKQISRLFLLLPVMALASSASRAQAPLRLPDAVNLALKNSLDIQLVQNKVEASTINNNYGIAGGMPLVTGTLGDNESVANINQKLNTGTTIERSGAATNALSAGITGSILLYNGGRVVAAKKRLGELEKQSRQELTSSVQNIMAAVMNSYYDVVRQQDYMKTIEKSVESAQKKLDIVKVRQQVGLANNADLFQAQLDLNEALQARQTQELVIRQAQSGLLNQLTLNPDSTITVKDTIIVDRSIELAAILKNISANADIQAAEQQIKISLLQVKETAAQRYPSLRATAGYNFTRNQAAAGQVLLNQSYGPVVGVTLGIPIYNGSVYRRQQRTAELNVKNAQLQKESLIRDYTAEVIRLHQSYADAIKQLDAERENYKLSGQLLDLVLQRFQLKEATIIDVKNAQQSFEASGFRLVNLSYAAKSAEIGLKRLANKLSL